MRYWLRITFTNGTKDVSNTLASRAEAFAHAASWGQQSNVVEVAIVGGEQHEEARTLAVLHINGRS